MASLFDKLFLNQEKQVQIMNITQDSLEHFPYGEKQRNMVYELLHQLFPKLNQTYVRKYYLLLKKKMQEEPSIGFDRVCERIKGYHFVKMNPNLNKKMKILIESDLAIDENLKYPTLKTMVEQSEN